VPAKVQVIDKAFDVEAGGRHYRIEMHTPLRDVVIRGTCNGEPFVAQIERIGLSYRVTHNGTQIDAKVFTPRAAELNALMPFKAPPDLSKFLLSPMPGLLVDVAVTPGQTVRAGEKLAVIEAMKMENILVAVQDCVVSEVVAKKGESLAVDQVIVKFQ
jgi:propionyl-CoA carboxylase alpha chain